MYSSESDELHLYHLTLLKQSNHIQSCIGHFIDSDETDANANGPRRMLQLCLATETSIELYDISDGALKLLATIPLFATITCVRSCTLEKSKYSYLMITSDAGNLTVANVVRIAGKIRLQPLYNEPLTRSGIRRLSPISSMEIDTNGRCVFLCARERNKLCFLLDSHNDSLTVSSALEANRQNVIVLDTASCDVRYDNPCFACIELNTTKKDDYHLVFYVLDLGLNHIVKRADYKLNTTANFVMGLPELSRYGITTNIENSGYYDTTNEDVNPFTIIGFENYILLKDMNGYYNLKVQIPKRKNNSSGPTVIISYAIQTLKNNFFVLLQSNFGDLFKVSIAADQNDRNRPIVSICYFDTIYPAENMQIFKNGYLFTTSELGDSYLFQFESLGDDIDPVMISTSKYPETTVYFEPSDHLQNLSIAERKIGHNPLFSMNVTKPVPLMMQTQSNLVQKILQNGVEIEDIITSQLPSGIENLWSIKLNSEYHSLLFLGTPRSTLILRIDNDTIEEYLPKYNPFIIKNDKSIFISSMGNDSVIQVCENELKQVIFGSDEVKTKLDWLPPAGIRILAACCTKTQLALALSNHELVYFEMHDGNDTLNELQMRAEIEETVTCISMLNKNRSDFLAVGTADSSVKVISLKSGNTETFLEVISLQTVVSPVTDLKLVQYNNEAKLHIGLANGVYNISDLSLTDGGLSKVKAKFVGAAPVLLSVHYSTTGEAEINGDEDDNEASTESVLDPERRNSALRPSVFIHCTQTWLSYYIDSLLYIRPVLEENSFIKIAEFMTENIRTNTLCAINSNGLLIIGRIKKFTALNDWLDTTELPLVPNNDLKDNANNEGSDDDEDDEDNDTFLPWRKYGTGTSCQLLNNNECYLVIENLISQKGFAISISKCGKPYKEKISRLQYKEILDHDCMSAIVTNFGSTKDYLIVSASDRSLYCYAIHLSKTNGDSFQLDLVHSTAVDDLVHTMGLFDNKLLVVVQGHIVLYGLGKKQLLRKSISPLTASIKKVVSIAVWENERIAVGDSHESVTIFIFFAKNNVFLPIADDITKRYVSKITFLDSRTVIGGDRFGNIWTLRLSSEVDQILRNEENNLDTILHRQNTDLRKKVPNVMVCPFKLKLLNHFFVNDIVTSFHVVQSLQMSNRFVIIYSGIQGTIASLIPLLSKTEISNYHQVEQMMAEASDTFFLTQEKMAGEQNKDSTVFSTKGNTTKRPEGYYSIVGRDHLSYRGYYSAVRNVIDGDLCETFLALAPSEQQFLSSNLEKLSHSNIISLLNEVRTNYI